jgi:cytoskeleton protein RodZ
MNTHTDRRDDYRTYKKAPASRDAIGATLAAARDASGRSIDDIADVLKIGTRHLTALEEGWWDELPSPTYAAGFLRSYARHLGLDAEALVARFKAENVTLREPPRLLFPEPLEVSRVPRMPLVILSAFMALAAYCGWYFMAGPSYAGIETANIVPPRLAALAAAENIDISLGAPAEAAGPAAPGAAPDTHRIAAAARPVASIPVLSSPIAMVETPDIPRRSHVNAPARRVSLPSTLPLVPHFPAPVLIHSAHAAVPGEGADSRITLRAKADTWILVEDGDARTLRQGVLKAGEQYRAPDRSGLTLTTSNMKALEILVDGVAVHEEAGGGIERGMSLDADKLAAATL